MRYEVLTAVSKLMSWVLALYGFVRSMPTFHSNMLFSPSRLKWQSWEVEGLY